MSARLLEYNIWMGSLAVHYVNTLGIQSNNMGVIANDTSHEGALVWLEVTGRLGPHPHPLIGAAPNSVRTLWTAYCGGRNLEACIKAGGDIQYLRDLTEAKLAGNCQEKDAVAILWLARHLVRKLDI